MNVSRLVLLVLAVCGFRLASGAGAHIGFDVDSAGGGYPQITRVYAHTHAEEIGVRTGMRVVSVAGMSVKDNAAIERRIAKKNPGDRVVVKLRAGEDERSAIIALATVRQVQAELNLEEAEENMLATMERIGAEHGAVVASGGSIEDDEIGTTKLCFSVWNVADFEVDAVEVRVELFDKFDRPVSGAFGNSNSKSVLYQEAIPAKSSCDLSIRLPFHQTAGKAKLSVTKYLPTGRDPVDVEDPYVIEVKR
jgi:hypothetical protein